ncbi:secreted in xylem 11 [Colletotrichum scovillei]|uniref:Secreted in xylem 11 n=1 Tax=Colletotrichum scovillei TaxID=1209932 RepID=A0A9P7U982_9PEZI|nr:secreted in xylem 11 [Colletotrichum scovillei]KAG7052368.1 secreted in xylem 11 [Colletotrichum scovillei]KAG7064658.1 secreted in xylem 11 [Colletotrichum scovillei]
MLPSITPLLLLAAAGTSHAINICCSSFAGHTCTKDQYNNHRQNVILNQIINVDGRNCVRKGAGPGAWTSKKDWSEWYDCQQWVGPEQHQIEVGECTLFCVMPSGLLNKPFASEIVRPEAAEANHNDKYVDATGREEMSPGYAQKTMLESSIALSKQIIHRVCGEESIEKSAD